MYTELEVIIYICIALDYACGSGGDCLPLQPDGLCFLPNTIQAHASYAFNSYYQRRARAPGSCDFAGTATIATSDPSIIYNFSLHFHFCFSVDQCDLIFILWICFCLCRLWILCVPFFCKVWPFSVWFYSVTNIILLLKKSWYYSLKFVEYLKSFLFFLTNNKSVARNVFLIRLLILILYGMKSFILLSVVCRAHLQLVKVKPTVFLDDEVPHQGTTNHKQSFLRLFIHQSI